MPAVFSGVPDEFSLSIDFGTAHTVAALRSPDGRVSPLLFDATPLLRSAVCALEGRRLLTGRDAERAARLDPAGFEPYPKRRVDETAVLLGAEQFPVAELVAAVLRRVADEARRVSTASTARTLLTHPAGWGQQRRQVLLDAAGRAGLGAVALMPEPFAAAQFLARSVGRQVAIGSALVVYDLGSGTFDISVIRHCGDGAWELIANDGLDDLGGLDLDTVIVDWVGATVGRRDPALWQRLLHPTTADERQQHRQLWDEARVTKEQLSRASVATLRVPALGVDVHQTREEFERAARPLLDRTVALTASTLFRTGLAADRVAGVLLVGGSTRVPLVATLLHQRLGIAPTVVDHPELVVAIGGLQARLAPAAPPATPPPERREPVIVHSGQSPPSPAALAPQVPVAEPRRRRPRWRGWAWAAVAAVLAVTTAVVVAMSPWSPRDPSTGPSTTPPRINAVAATFDRPATVVGANATGTNATTIKVTLSKPRLVKEVDLGSGRLGRPKRGVYVVFDAKVEVVDGVYALNSLHFLLVPKSTVAQWRDGDGGTVPEPVPGFEPSLKSARLTEGDRSTGSLVFDVPESAVTDAAVVLRSWLLTNGPAAAYWPLG